MDRKITIVFFEAGGGHRSAAEALKAVLESQARPWKVELLNLQELLDRLDMLKKLTGLRIQDGYNLILRKGWTRLTRRLRSTPVFRSGSRWPSHGDGPNLEMARTWRGARRGDGANVGMNQTWR